MPSRPIRNPQDMASWCAYLQTISLEKPITVSWRKGIDRSGAQNSLMWKWANEIAEQKGDEHADDIHAYNKLHVGIPYRRGVDDEYRAFYDANLRQLDYEVKLAMMKPPIDLPVTRDLTVKQMTELLDRIYDYWSAQGYQLTLPEVL